MKNKELSVQYKKLLIRLNKTFKKDGFVKCRGRLKHISKQLKRVRNLMS